MIIEQSFRAMIIKPIFAVSRKVVGASYYIVEMKKYFFDDEYCVGGFVYKDEPREVTLAEANEFEPDIHFYDDYGRYRRIYWAITGVEDFEFGYRVFLRFRFGELKFDLNQIVIVPCISQLNK